MSEIPFFRHAYFFYKNTANGVVFKRPTFCQRIFFVRFGLGIDFCSNNGFSENRLILLNTNGHYVRNVYFSGINYPWLQTRPYRKTKLFEITKHRPLIISIDLLHNERVTAVCDEK